jgi:hypothetical protein
MFNNCIKFTNKILPFDFDFEYNIDEVDVSIEFKNIYKLKIKLCYINDNNNNDNNNNDNNNNDNNNNDNNNNDNNNNDNDNDIIKQYIIITIIKNNFAIFSEKIRIIQNNNESYYNAINIGLEKVISYKIEDVYVEIYSLSILELMRKINNDKTTLAKKVKINIKKFNKINFGVPQSD